MEFLTPILLTLSSFWKNLSFKAKAFLITLTISSILFSGYFAVSTWTIRGLKKNLKQQKAHVTRLSESLGHLKVHHANQLRIRDLEIKQLGAKNKLLALAHEKKENRQEQAKTDAKRAELKKELTKIESSLKQDKDAFKSQREKIQKLDIAGQLKKLNAFYQKWNKQQ